MNITIVADVLGKANNGTSLATYNLINYLKSKGHNVKVVCPDEDKKDKEGFYVLGKRNLWPFNKYLAKNGVILAKKNKKLIASACKDANIVHCMIPFTASKAALKYCLKHNIPVTSGFHMQAENFTSHLKCMNSKLVNHLVYKYLWNHFYKKVNAIHYPTEFIRDYVKKYNKRNVLAYSISNGVDTNNFYINKIDKEERFKNKFVILMSGRFSAEKNQKDLINAIKLSKHENDIQLVFAGTGPKEEMLRHISKGLTNPPIFKLYKHENLHDILWQADLCVHTSKIEIEAISVLEAFACGLVPVISNSPRSATSKFALTKESLYNHKSIKDLSEKIDYWFEHDEEREKYKIKYANYAKQFSFNQCMEKMEKMLIEMSKQKRNEIIYKDELNDDFANNNIKTKKVKTNYKYIHKNIFFRFTAYLFRYLIALPILYLVNKTVYGVKVKNKKVLKQVKKTGYFIYSNHVVSLDPIIQPVMINPMKQKTILASDDAFSIKPLKLFVDQLGAIPLPNNTIMYKGFMERMKNDISKKKCILIYPERHIWPYYTGIRKFLPQTLSYPVMLNRPVIVATTTFKKRKHRKPRVIIHLDGPFYPDPLLRRKEATEKLANDVYMSMVINSQKDYNYSYIKYRKVDN